MLTDWGQKQDHQLGTSQAEQRGGVGRVNGPGGGVCVWAFCEEVSEQMSLEGSRRVRFMLSQWGPEDRN